MANDQYVIIGDGMPAAAAVDGIREGDSPGIVLISAELDAPYDRPPLSTTLWKGTSLDSIWRKTENKEVKDAAQLIAEPGPFTLKNLKGAVAG